MRDPPSFPLLRFARFDLDSHAPAIELDRLMKLRDRWQNCRDRLELIALEAGNVGDYSATLKGVLESHPIDVVVLPMAVADYEPEAFSGKISSDRESLVVHCRRTPKVIRLVRDWAPSVYLVGFKLLSHVPVEELIRAGGKRLSCQLGRSHGCERPGNAARGPAHRPPRPARPPSTRRLVPALTLPIAWLRASSNGPPNRAHGSVQR